VSAGLTAGRPSRGIATPSFSEVAAAANDLVRINFNVSRDVRTALKIYAAEHETTISDLLVRYVEGLVAKGR
jgi:hypothetical protein